MQLMRASDRFWTLSNVVSLVRLALTVPIVIALVQDSRWLALCLSLVAAASDWFDGYAARATKTVSEWGKIIDPIADKILVGAVVVILVVKDLLPLWFVAMVLLRDVVILVFAAYLRRRITVVPPSLMSGKLAVGAISLVGIAAMADWTLVRDAGITLSAILTAVSLWQYGKRFYGIIRQI